MFLVYGDQKLVMIRSMTSLWDAIWHISFNTGQVLKQNEQKVEKFK